MRWLILGAGGIGGYFGARLAQAGRDVTFLVRERRQAELTRYGLVVQSPLGDAHIAAPKTVLSGAITAPYDVILLSCKAYDLQPSMDAVAPAVGPDTAILPALNGMSHIKALQQRLGAESVLGGVCMISAALTPDRSRIEHLNRAHGILWGELDGSLSPRVHAIEAEFAGTNCHPVASDQILQEMWEKWVMINTVAGSNCLLRASIGDIVRAGATDIPTGIYAEAASIAQANGHPPRPQKQQAMLKYATDPESYVTASMLKDLEHGARAEGEHIVGDLIRRAPDASALRLLPIVYAHLRAYEARREREAAAAR